MSELVDIENNCIHGVREEKNIANRNTQDAKNYQYI